MKAMKAMTAAMKVVKAMKGMKTTIKATKLPMKAMKAMKTQMNATNVLADAAADVCDAMSAYKVFNDTPLQENMLVVVTARTSAMHCMGRITAMDIDKNEFAVRLCGGSDDCSTDPVMLSRQDFIIIEVPSFGRRR